MNPLATAAIIGALAGLPVAAILNWIAIKLGEYRS